MATGKVKWFSEEKGFGFIVPDDGGKDLFVHRSHVATPDRLLRNDERVQYDLGEGRKGAEAQNVRVT